MITFTSEITSRNDQQTDLFEAIALVYSHASNTWKEEADQVVRHLCKTRQFFSADDVLEQIKSTTPDNRALGQVMKDAARNGLIRSTGRYEQSRIAKRHRRPVAIWESIPPRT
jgi:hypothetical protein